MHWLIQISCLAQCVVLGRQFTQKFAPKQRTRRTARLTNALGLTAPGGTYDPDSPFLIGTPSDTPARTPDRSTGVSMKNSGLMKRPDHVTDQDENQWITEGKSRIKSADNLDKYFQKQVVSKSTVTGTPNAENLRQLPGQGRQNRQETFLGRGSRRSLGGGGRPGFSAEENKRRWDDMSPEDKDDANQKAKRNEMRRDRMLQKYIEDQNKANMERMEGIAKRSFEMGNKLQDDADARAVEFDTGVQEAKKQMVEMLDKTFERANADFPDMEFNVDPGQGSEEAGLQTTSSFAADLKRIVSPDDNWATIGDPSEEDVIANNDIEDLLIKECYRSVAHGNQDQVDKNCLTADILTYRCVSPIDASNYIGVTFDILKGYSMTGFRGRLVKPWCREMNTYKNIFDIPDGMHIQGVYETKMETETFSSVGDYIQSESTKSNAQVGTSAFQEERSQIESTEVDSLVGTVGISIGGEVPPGSGAAGTTASVAFEYQNTNLEGKFVGDQDFSNGKRMQKTTQLSQAGKKKSNKVDKMVAKMSIKVIRYEMFLREVAPNYLMSTFLDTFLKLPQSYFAPGGPRKFLDFIQRYGTHYVKAAKFGGELKIVKSRERNSQTDTLDFRDEAQVDFNNIVGSGGADATTKRKEDSEDIRFSANVKNEEKGIELDIAGSQTKTGVAENNTLTTNQRATVNTIGGGTGDRAVKSEALTEFRDTSKITASGGSHQIATTITDLYSPNFRVQLISWLKSIPHYPFPFDMVFEPITTLMYHLLDDMVDGDCYQTCLIDREEYCVKEREQKVGCDTHFGKYNVACKAACHGDPEDTDDHGHDAHGAHGGHTRECVVTSTRLIDCWEILDQKDKFKRKIDALETAVTEYIKKGGNLIVVNKIVPASPPACTTSYKKINLFDPFALNHEEDESIDWPRYAFANLHLVFNMKRFYFNTPNGQQTEKVIAARIFPNEQFYMKFNEKSRRWYTKETLPETLHEKIASDQVPFDQLERGDTTGRGTYHLMPKRQYVGDESFVQIRLKQGLYVDLSLNNGDILYTQRNFDAMKRAATIGDSEESLNVKNFMQHFEEDLKKMAKGTGQVLGLVNPVALDLNKVPFPCYVPWTSGQMFESNEDVQQCVKLTTKLNCDATGTCEYFFVMAANIADKSTWIYLHQTPVDLCLRKLDATLSYDEINVCASRFGSMASHNIQDLVEQLIVCTYNKGDLLSFQVSRPSYDRLQREGAISIINHSIVQNENDPFIIPRYYSVGSGETEVTIEGIEMTEIETLECQLPYVTEQLGGTFRCALDCSEECSYHGCKEPLDSRECYSCQNTKVVIRREGVNNDIVDCLPDCGPGTDALETLRIRYNQPTLKVTVTGLEEFQNAGTSDVANTAKVCISCHEECNFGCDGPTNRDCTVGSVGIGEWRCKNVEHQYETAAHECLAQCPDGYYAQRMLPADPDGPSSPLTAPSCPNVTDTSLVNQQFDDNGDLLVGVCRLYCTKCPDNCATCDSDIDKDVYDNQSPTPQLIAEAKKCLSCHTDYLSAEIDSKYKRCIVVDDAGNTCTDNLNANNNYESCCPPGFQRYDNQHTLEKRCMKRWRAIGFQKLSEDPFPSGQCNEDCTDPATQGTEHCVKACNVKSGANFLNLGSKEFFKLFLRDGDTQGEDNDWDFFGQAPHYSFQLAWKIDSCSVAVLEWKQIKSPFESSHDVSKVRIESFHEVKCQITDPQELALKKVTFTDQDFFLNCPADKREIIPIRCTTDENDDSPVTPECLGFAGIAFSSTTVGIATRDQTVFTGNTGNSGLYNFGFTERQNEAKAYLTGGTTQAYSSEMQLSVHDDREPALGWTPWKPTYDTLIDGTVTSLKRDVSDVAYQAAYKCQVTCDPILGNTKQQLRHRYCQCFIGKIEGYAIQDAQGTVVQGTSGDPATVCHKDRDIINDNDCPLTFRKYCQPCAGDIEHEQLMLGECQVNSCIADNSDCDTDGGCEETEVEATHFGCCESSAIRVFGKNKYGNELELYRERKLVQNEPNVLLEINGIYELDYNNQEDADGKIKHSYIMMNGQDFPQNGQKVSNPFGPSEITYVQNLRYNRIEQNDDGTWELKVPLPGVDPVNEDNMVTLFQSTKANCPSQAIAWKATTIAFEEDYVDRAAEIAITCSTGRNACPASHPFAYDYGRHCCNSPIYHGISNPTAGPIDPDTGVLDIKKRLLRANDLEACPKDISGAATTDRGYPLCTASSVATCYGEYVKCPLNPIPCRGDDCPLTADGDIDRTVCPDPGDKSPNTVFDPPCNRCRTNLKSQLPAMVEFKALSNNRYTYKYKLCTDQCNTVHLEAVEFP